MYSDQSFFNIILLENKSNGKEFHHSRLSGMTQILKILNETNMINITKWPHVIPPWSPISPNITSTFTNLISSLSVNQWRSSKIAIHHSSRQWQSVQFFFYTLPIHVDLVWCLTRPKLDEQCQHWDIVKMVPGHFYFLISN